jgi:uncharacterized protein YyaL (SSP411 family)
MQTVAASITEILLRADARGEPLGPAGVTFLVRRYAATGANQLRGALERGLTDALDGLAAGRHPKADWIHTLCEAATVTDDERILEVVAGAAHAVREQWPGRGGIADALRGVDACLTAALVLGISRDLIGAAVDELERVICIAYRPGEMLPRSLRSADEADGGIDEHLAAATALLTAHDATARLPYSMLAEELIQPLRLTSGPEGPHDVSTAGAKGPRYVRVLCRLARLHDDEEYRQAAVIVRSCDYRTEAKAVLDNITPQHGEPIEDLAMFGIAMDELARAS